MLQLIAEREVNEISGGCEPAVEEDRGQHGLEHIGEQGTLVSSPALLFTVTDAQVFSYLQTPGSFGERGRANKSVLHAREFALGDIRVILKQKIRDDEAEH